MASTEMTVSSVTPRAARPTLEKVLLLVVRLGLAYLFFTQLWWKVPPTFGCPADFAFTTGTIDAGRIRLDRTTGLCDWLGIQKFYAENRPLRALEANLDNTGAPELFLDLSALRQLNGWVVTNVIMPNIAVMGWLIWLAELSIVLLVGLGLFSRLGGLIALGVSAQLYVGLANIPSPYEWEWVYLNMVLLSVVVIATAPGRFYGLDALLIPRLKRMNNSIARVLLIFTGR
ncbi:MAG: TQO small subunit DoxD [Chloroflexota bacterium]|nr:TQO small subunit DoxD [Chloroflexota bacterium]